MTSGFVVLYVSLLWRANDLAHLGISVLYGWAIVTILRSKWSRFALSNNLASLLVGMGLTVLLLIKLALLLPMDATVLTNHPLLRIYPLLGAIALILMAAGVSGFRLFWQELVILFFLGVPRVILGALSDPAPLAAQSATLLLRCFRVDAFLEGVIIYVPGAALKVNEPCSGIESMTYLLGLSVICLLLFPVKGRLQKIFVPLVAILLGFVLNAARVALLAVLAAFDDPSAFDYWHAGEGSLLFGLIAVVLFGGVYWVVLMRSEVQSMVNHRPHA